MGIQFKTGQEIAGIPALKIRNLVRDIADRSFAKEWLYEKGLSEVEAERVLEILLQHGYIELTAGRASDPRAFYKLTDQGRVIMRATGAKRVRRETAQRILKEFMNRVQIVNESTRFLVRIKEVVIFGSYLSDKETLGDLDIACAYENKVAHLDHQEFVQKVRDHFEASGRSYRGLVSEMFWPWEEVHLFLKKKSRTISLHSMDDVDQLIEKSSDFPFQVLLGDREAIMSRNKVRAQRRVNESKV